MNTLDLTCSCGARIVATAAYSGDIARERRAFNEAHAACRPAPERLVPRLCEVRKSPPRPDPLPNPTVPSV